MPALTLGETEGALLAIAQSRQTSIAALQREARRLRVLNDEHHRDLTLHRAALSESEARAEAITRARDDMAAAYREENEARLTERREMLQFRHERNQLVFEMRGVLAALRSDAIDRNVVAEASAAAALDRYTDVSPDQPLATSAATSSTSPGVPEPDAATFDGLLRRIVEAWQTAHMKD